MALTPEELAKLTDEELAAEMRRAGDGDTDATAILRELVRRSSPNPSLTVEALFDAIHRRVQERYRIKEW